MHVIYVDDEQPALDNFEFSVKEFQDITSLKLFLNGEEALEWAKENPVDVAFLDMDMPSIHGLDLARKLKNINYNIRIVFVTAYSEFALEAFEVDAIGYVKKPYFISDLRKELDKAALIKTVPLHRVVIQTIPNFSVTIDEKPLCTGREKVLELFALLVDRKERGITSGEGIAYLWPEREKDLNTQSLFRVTYKRLVDMLDKAGVRDIITSKGNRRAIRTDLVECDLYRILAGDTQTAKKYNGQYMREYSWAEERNGQLYRMLLL